MSFVVILFLTPIGTLYDGTTHHHVVSSNYLLPSLYACLSYIVELWKVVQGAGVCEECALQHVRHVLCCQAAFTCCVSVEISPLLPLFFATSVSSS